MKTIAKILLIIFFFIFSFLNNSPIFDNYVQDGFSCAKKHEHRCSIEPIEKEGFIILPSNSNNNNTISSVGSSYLAPTLKNSFFAKKRYIVKNQYTIAHLYKTEIFPNAP